MPEPENVTMIWAEPVATGLRTGSVAVISVGWTEKFVMALTELLALSSRDRMALTPVVARSVPEILTTFPPNLEPEDGVTDVAVGAA